MRSPFAPGALETLVEMKREETSQVTGSVGRGAALHPCLTDLAIYQPSSAINDNGAPAVCGPGAGDAAGALHSLCPQEKIESVFPLHLEEANLGSKCSHRAPCPAQRAPLPTSLPLHKVWLDTVSSEKNVFRTEGCKLCPSIQMVTRPSC